MNNDTPDWLLATHGERRPGPHPKVAANEFAHAALVTTMAMTQGFFWFLQERRPNQR